MCSCLHVWPKLALFYSTLALVAVFAVRRPVGRNLLLLLLVAALPIIGLGAAWSGGTKSATCRSIPSCSCWSPGRHGRRSGRGIASCRRLLACWH